MSEKDGSGYGMGRMKIISLPARAPFAFHYPRQYAARATSRVMRFWILVATLTLGGLAANSSAAVMTYTMSWDSVTGTYGATSFTNQPMTLRFSNYDTANLGSFAGLFPLASFTNGASMSVTLGTILTGAALDDVAANSSGLISVDGSSIYFGYVSDGNYTTDRGFLSDFVSPPASANAVFTTEWTSVATASTISEPWASYPLVIGGESLVLSISEGPVSGSWTSAPAVPEPGKWALVLLGGASLFGWRKLVRSGCRG